MEENNKEILEDVKKRVVQSTNKIDEVCDAQGEKAMELLKKRVPALNDIAKDPLKLGKTIILINIIATAIMLFAFYFLPAFHYKDSTLTLTDLLNLFGGITSQNTYGGSNANWYVLIYCGKILKFFTFANLGVAIYTLLTKKVVPYVSNRILSIFTLIFMIIEYFLFLLILEETLIGIYVGLLASIIVGLTGLLMFSKSK